MANTKKIASNKKSKKLSYEWRRIIYFFQWYSIESSSEHLWEMLKLALTSEDENGDLKERSTMLNFYEHGKELIENIYIVLKEKTKSKKE